LVVLVQPDIERRRGAIQVGGLRLYLLRGFGRRRAQDSSEVCRVSGKIDAVRLPKEAYFASA